MPRGIYVRTPEYRQKLRDAWYSSEKNLTKSDKFPFLQVPA